MFDKIIPVAPNVGIANAPTTLSFIERVFFMIYLEYKPLGTYAIIMNIIITGIKRISFYLIM